MIVLVENIGNVNIEINIDSEIRIFLEEMDKMIKDVEIFLIEDIKVEKN